MVVEGLAEVEMMAAAGVAMMAVVRMEAVGMMVGVVATVLSPDEFLQSIQARRPAVSRNHSIGCRPKQCTSSSVHQTLSP